MRAYYLKFSLLLFLLLPFLSGCLDYESQTIFITLQPDLSGKMSFEFQNIHSTEEKEDEQLKEMKALYEKDAQEMVLELEKEWRLKDVQLQIQNKTDKNCNARLEGTFTNIACALNPLIEESRKFSISRDEKRLNVSIMLTQTAMSKTKLYIQYSLNVLKNNADKMDAEKKVLEWDLDKKEPFTIEFELESSPLNKSTP